MAVDRASLSDFAGRPGQHPGIGDHLDEPHHPNARTAVCTRAAVRQSLRAWFHERRLCWRSRGWRGRRRSNGSRGQRRPVSTAGSAGTRLGDVSPLKVPLSRLFPERRRPEPNRRSRLCRPIGSSDIGFAEPLPGARTCFELRSDLGSSAHGLGHASGGPVPRSPAGALQMGSDCARESVPRLSGLRWWLVGRRRWCWLRAFMSRILVFAIVVLVTANVTLLLVGIVGAALSGVDALIRDRRLAGLTEDAGSHCLRRCGAPLSVDDHCNEPVGLSRFGCLDALWVATRCR
jgi:hypothetical protein